MFPSGCVTVTDHGSDCREPAREVDGLAGRARGRGGVHLGQAGLRDGARDRRQLSVELAARAARVPGVPVPRDRAQRDHAPRRVLRVSGRAPTEGRKRIDVRHVQAPREEPDERGASRGRDRGRVVRPDQRDADRPLVEPLRVRADDVAVDTAPPAFEDLAVLVDEEVVTDVVPAVREHVVALDPAHDRGRLRAAVRVRAGRVVDDREAQRVGVGGLLAPANLLVRAPARPGDDQRRARLRDRPQPDLADRAPDVVRADTADRGRTCAPGFGWRARSSTGCRAATRSRAARVFARRARRPRAQHRASRSSVPRRFASGTRRRRCPSSAARPGRTCAPGD